MGLKRYKEGDYKGPFEYWTEAAALGDAEAHFELSTWYRNGEVLRRMRKNNCTEQAAIAGHPYARHNLALSEDEDGRLDKAVKHWIIDAKLGAAKSLDNLKELYKDGDVSKDDFTTALRGNRAAIHETKSPQREEAEEFFKRLAERRSGAVWVLPICWAGGVVAADMR